LEAEVAGVALGDPSLFTTTFSRLVVNESPAPDGRKLCQKIYISSVSPFCLASCLIANPAYPAFLRRP